MAALGSRLVSKVLVIGAAGMIGRKLAAALRGEDLILQDVAPFEGTVSDLAAPGEAEKLIARHLVSAADVSDMQDQYRDRLDRGGRRHNAGLAFPE